MYEIIFTNQYEKRALKFFKKHPELKNRYIKILKILQVQPLHPSLRLHKLQGKRKQFYSISISMSYRILLDFIIEDKRIILIDIGTHSSVYE
jgi:addiction module RelE/StbE family toxin